MKTKTINLYSFNELSDEAKQFALNKYRYSQVSWGSEWDMFVLEECESLLKENGFDNPKIHYSGFYSQGDGASFDADIDLEKFLTPNEREALKGVDIAWEIYRISHQYVHELSRSIDYCGEHYPEEFESMIESITQRIEASRLSSCKEVYRILGKEYDYLVSDECLIARFIEMGDDFLETGNFS
jgi:hypothetical protein